MTKLTVKQTEPATVAEVLASDISAIAQGVRKLRSGPLNDRALILLIQHAIVTPTGETTISQKTVKRVLDGIGALESEYIKKRAK